jgi:hypothetical protein
MSWDLTTRRPLSIQKLEPQVVSKVPTLKSLATNSFCAAVTASVWRRRRETGLWKTEPW